MPRNPSGVLAMALAAWLSPRPMILAQPAAAMASEITILQIRIAEGEGAVYAAGSRAARPLAVQVSDETGRPVSGVAVHFRLPDQGPGGVFASGLRTELVTSGPDGRAEAGAIQWSRVPGPCQIRVTAAKGEIRAGILVTQYLSTELSAQPAATLSRSSLREQTATGAGKSYSRWLIITSLVAGAAVGGLAAAKSGGKTPPAAPAPAPAPQPPAPSVVIGAPSITIGNP